MSGLQNTQKLSDRVESLIILRFKIEKVIKIQFSIFNFKIENSIN